MSQANPYTLTRENTLAPPTTVKERLKYLGPGFILSASIVGSGELIATTALGAKAGFITLWVILVSCLVKVAVQLEFGKQAILSGKTAMQLFNELPGPKIGKAHWTIWSFLTLMTLKISQVGGIVGGVAIIATMILPQLSLGLAAYLVAAIVALMIFKGYYKFIEKFSLVLIAIFSLFTIYSLLALQATDYAVNMSEVLSGLTFQLPAAAVGVAIAAFGITGVGGDEIIAYNYWCLEKGYARYTGPYDEHDPEWENRAKGWIKVMHLDAIVSMLVYTILTAAFYLLGASVLHKMGKVPEGYETINILSEMYTQALGPGIKNVFLLGAFIVLFSTVFGALAGWTRHFSDMFGQIGWINFFDEKDRSRSIAILAFVFPFLWASLYLSVKLPVFLVLFGGVVTSVILLFVVYGAIYFRYYKTMENMLPKRAYDIILWISSGSILILAVYGLVKLMM